MAKLVWVLGIEIQVGGNTRLTRQGKTVVCLSWRKFYEINQENELVRDPDELRRTPTNSDELRRTPTNSDELCENPHFLRAELGVLAPNPPDVQGFEGKMTLCRWVSTPRIDEITQIRSYKQARKLSPKSLSDPDELLFFSSD